MNRFVHVVLLAVVVGSGASGLWLNSVSAVAADKEKATLEGLTQQVFSVALSPDGKMLASGGGGFTARFENVPGEIKLWDVATGKEKATLRGRTAIVWSVAYSPDGKTLASGSGDKTIKLWDAQTGKEQATFKGHTASVHFVVYSPDGKTLASGAGFGDQTIKLWDVRTGKEQATLNGHTGWVMSLAYSPDSKTLASGSHDKTIKLWDVSPPN